MPPEIEKHITRRNALITAGGVAAITVGASFLTRPDGATTIVGAVDVSHLKDLGDGYYLVDGWVLTKADLKSADVAHAAPANLFADLYSHVD